MIKSDSFHFLKRKPVVLKDRCERLRGVANTAGFTSPERLRVTWMVFYCTVGKEYIERELAKAGNPVSPYMAS